ncbi:hypothetical protein SAY86_024705 [Trapa natans]|uniref:AP180 N-terminal homology (ANTH) domain-containing protein n=1 Tax=Trapa natans TaxID=22666 RepID=A0AAN7REJ6_TRANT|nr:hypothetical protein SAY86_024705 [Trapa natans]
MAIFVDRFMELDIPENVKVYEMFAKISKQFEELDSFYAWSRDAGVARPTDYPEVEKITQKRLDVMDELIRDKTALAQGKEERKKKKETAEQDESTSDQQKEQPEEEEEADADADATKALALTEDAIYSENAEEKPDKEEEPDKEDKKEIAQQEADLLNLGDDYVTSEEHSDTLTLALFDGIGHPASSAPSLPAWEAFPSGSADWETALVQSASCLPNQSVAQGGGFDMSLLDGMYQQGAIVQAAVGNHEGSGSASSVALGSAGRPAMLALPAPPAPNGSIMASGGDPFTASLAVAPPSYVQMSEMEKKQKLLMDEQLMWQQYAANGRGGHIGMGNPYNRGVYSRQY